MTTTEFYPCTCCGTAVGTLWEDGALLPGDYIIVAGWVTHVSCWEGLVRENPPDQTV